MKKYKNNTNNELTLDHHLATNLSGLLHKVLRYYDVDGLHQMILHEIGHDNSLGLKKATYLIDNPDFDHLSGIAGYDNKECHYHGDNIWKDPYQFKNKMKEATFHNNVKNYLNSSLKKKDINLNDAKEVLDLGIHLGLSKPSFFSWNMKHGNHGLLFYEDSNENNHKWRKNLLYNIAALLSFCGI